MNNKKEFDAVKMMREIRDKISKETMDMTFEEFKAYIRAKLKDKTPHTTLYKTE